MTTKHTPPPPPQNQTTSPYYNYRLEGGGGGVRTVVELLKKQSPLTAKQEKFCDDACVERFLRAKGHNAKKAAKQLRACLSWRDSIATDYLIADEFSAELADGMAYVAGHDQELRPVLIFRIKQDYHKLHSQKQLTRLLVFTIEVAIQTMARKVEQLVMILDASFFRSASSFMNMFLATLKIMADYYPGRVYRAFVIDPPSLFPYLWKGMKPFVELAPLTTILSSHNFDDLVERDDFDSHPRTASLRLDASSIPKLGSCSSRFTFTVSHHLDSLKPWYLSLSDTSSSKMGPPSGLLGPTISPHNARSHSFASPIERAPLGYVRKGFFPSTPMPRKTQELDLSMIHHPRTPKPASFFQSPATFFQKNPRLDRSFLPFLKMYRRPYDEMVYRSKMKPPLGGLISIVSPQMRRRQMSISQRF